MTILILGGTAEAKGIAVALYQRKIPIIYSIAGLVRWPDLECPIVTGGFTQFGGLASFVSDNAITAILDATHPYAVNISRAATQAAQACSIPCWQYDRLAWQPSGQDQWFDFFSLTQLPEKLRSKKSIFLTTGQVSDSILANLVGLNDTGNILIRTAVKPAFGLLPNVSHVKSIGPFSFESELALLKKNNVDAIVSKNSGGPMAAKLLAARELSITVFMLARPQLLSASERFYSRDECVEFICRGY